MPRTIRCPRAPRAFTYLSVLWAVALAGATLAAAGQAWTLHAQREAEREMLFRGEQIALALARWQVAVATSGAAGPRQLEELLLDTRTAPPQRHLRRLWPDPASGEPDWVLERDETGAIVGLRSASTRPALLLRRLAADGKAPQAARWEDHRFAVPALPRAVPRGETAAGTVAMVPTAHGDPVLAPLSVKAFP